MNVVARSRLVAFWTQHPRSRASLSAWYAVASRAQWSSPQDVRGDFNTADFVADNRVIFDVGGNNYRIVARIAYLYKQVLIKFVGTHKDYDRIDPATVGFAEGGPMYDAAFAVRLLRTAEDYEAALVEYERLFDDEPRPGTAEADRFELLGLVIGKYEDEHFPIQAAAPPDVIRLVMEARGYGQSDLAQVLGSKSRASEILQGKRPLSLEQVRRLHAAWRIPVEALIGA